MRPAVITGVGTVLPGGPDLDALWDTLTRAATALSPIDRFDTTQFPNGSAGVVDDAALSRFPARQRKRMDRFCQLAMAAAASAIDDAELDEGLATDQIGVYMGNMFGGWGITDPSMRNLLQAGYRGVSPYIASAWFPTAPQGQITIEWGFKGFSKTVAADTASSAAAIGYAARAVTDGRASVMLCGGAEAPVTPYTYTFCTTTGRLSQWGYRPFDDNADGFCVGEGAVVLAVEHAEHARKRGAVALAEIAGWAIGHVRSDQALTRAGSGALASVISQALRDAQVSPTEIDYVALDGQGTTEADSAELAAVRSALGPDADPPCTAVKATTGHLLGAATATEVAGALLAMRHSAVPPMPGDPRPDSHGLRLVTDAPLPRPVRTVLVNSRGADGTVAACVLRAA